LGLLFGSLLGSLLWYRGVRRSFQRKLDSMTFLDEFKAVI